MPAADPDSQDSPALHRTIWYMGAKSRVIPGFLDRVFEAEVPIGGTVVDLMSGSGVVSAWCASRWRVFANDAQTYAWVIARSLLEHDSASKDRFLARVDLHRDLRAGFEKNRDALLSLLGGAVERERVLLDEFRKAGPSARWRKEYRDFLEEEDASGHETSPAGKRASTSPFVREDFLAPYRKNPRRKPACFAVSAYAHVYFGLEQSIALDSLRAAIDEFEGSGPLGEALRTHYLSALIHAASITTSGTSHFAQPRGTHKDSELDTLARRRAVDIFGQSEICSREILRTVAATSYREGNRASCGDYRSLLREATAPQARGRGAPGAPCWGFPAPVDLVYLDPPYTADNYSRFYHALDALARYDYPVLERDAEGRLLKGRYPSTSYRFSSGFCRRAAVADEFRAVLAATAASGAKLVISYSSPSGLLLKTLRAKDPDADPVLGFEAICRESYAEVRTLRKGILHSGSGDRNLPVEELLLVCTRPR